EFKETAQTAVYTLAQSWPSEGVWTLVIRAGEAPGMVATALVEIGTDGEIASVRLPTRMDRGTPIAVNPSIDDNGCAAIHARHTHCGQPIHRRHRQGAPSP